MKASSYIIKSRAKVIAALKDYPATFEEICRKSRGLYPSVVKEILSDLELSYKMVPLYSHNISSSNYRLSIDCCYKDNGSISKYIQNNPVLSAWYFSWNACSKLAKIDCWKGKRILFLGTPQLFEYFLLHRYGSHLTLIDLDQKVLSFLKDKHRDDICNSYCDFYCLDLLDNDANEIANIVGEQCDVVFFDPPWYMEYYLVWLNIATQVVKPNGTVVFSLLPALVRPDAATERKQLLKICREISNNAFVCTDFIDYDVPSFEKRELKEEGVVVNGNWKMADIVIMKGIMFDKFEMSESKIRKNSNWIEFDFLNTRWFLDVSENSYSCDQMISIVGKSRFLASPSRRNKQLVRVNLLSSKGHGLHVSDIQLFQEVIESIRESSMTDTYYYEVNKLNIDYNSKKLLMQLKEDC